MRCIRCQFDMGDHMEYARFERLVVGVTAVLVLGTIAASSLSGGSSPVEVIAQLMIVVVLAVAAHWGRKAGTIAALSACLIYLVMQLPLLSQQALSGAALLLVLSRIVGYCLVGIVGGEVFGRVKYLFAASKDSGVIDEWSRVYNQRYAAKALEQALARHERYQEPFSVVIVALAPDDTVEPKTGRLRARVRSVANFLRDDVRMVDDVARLDDGRFVVLLPHTAGAFAPIVASRLAEGVRQVLGVKEGGVTTTCLGADENSAALAEFAKNIGADEDVPEVEPAG
jgi:GGDEF domain-containing protein